MKWLQRFTKDTGEVHLSRAGEVLDQAVNRSAHGTVSLASWQMGDIDKVIEETRQASELEPSNPEYRYLFACALQARLQGADAEAELKRIIKDHPDYAQAEGHLRHRERWFLPFLYPAWSESHTTVTDSITPSGTQSCFVTPVRTGCRRVISFFGRMPGSTVKPILRPGRAATIRAVFMNTPTCPVVGMYALLDTHPTEPFTLEIVLSVDGYRSNWADCSRSGYWLIRLLGQQDFTYFVLAEPGNGSVYFNRLIKFDAKTKALLNSVAAQVRGIQQTERDGESHFMRARQYFSQNFSMDNITF